MNKIIFFLMILAISLFIFWRNKKKKINSAEKSTFFSIGDNCREIKSTPLIKCSDCNGYHVESKENSCCSACHSTANHRLSNGVSHCRQSHHHGQNCHSEFKQISIECGCLCWLIPLMLGVMIFLTRKHHK